MQYKDLIYKITSRNNTSAINDKLEDKYPDYNDAKKSVMTKAILIGIMIGDSLVLNKGIIDTLKAEIDRKLTVLFDSPISDSFALLPYDRKTLNILLDIFPDKKIHYIVDENETDDIKQLKNKKLNLVNLYYRTSAKNIDFVTKIDYLVTVNIDKLEDTLDAKLKEKNILVFPLNYNGTQQNTQKEKLVVPDPSGWVYNPANGMWVKSWGWDGYQELASWKAPNDWNLDPNPKIN